MKYKVIRSGRKSLALQIKNGEVIVRVPYGTKICDIENFVAKHRDWINRNLEKQIRKIKENTEKLTGKEIDTLMQNAKEIIPQRVAYYAPKVGVTYGKVSIKLLRSKWGSCSGKGNLNFNCLLMLAPMEVLDSVVVHELCHRKQMNHSDKFYKEVLHVYPEYHKWHSWLKEHGTKLIRSIPEDK